MASSNINNPSRKPPSLLIPPPSSVYSQNTSAIIIPVSPVSTTSRFGPGPGPGAHPNQGQRRAPTPRPPVTGHRRPSSSAFFRPAPTTYYPHPTRQDNREEEEDGFPLGGYDGAYDHLPPAASNPNSTTSPSTSTSNPDYLQNNPDKANKKGKKQVSSKSCLRVDKANLSFAAKAGIWLMGSTPSRLEQAARAQKEKRQRERQEKRERRERRREYRERDGGGEWGVEGGYGDDAGGGGEGGGD